MGGSGSALPGAEKALLVSCSPKRGDAAGDQEWGSLKSACDQEPPCVYPRNIEASSYRPDRMREPHSIFP